MLTLRRRGSFWYVRGTVKVGRETRVIAEHSTGCHRREDGDAYRSRLEAETRQELILGRSGRPSTLTIADAGAMYLARPGGIAGNDLWRLSEFNELIGDRKIGDARQAWAEFIDKRCGPRLRIDAKGKSQLMAALAPASVDRFRAILQAALNYAGELQEFPVPRIPRGFALPPRRVRYLAEGEQERLLAAYAIHVGPIATTLCFQGMRSGEALGLDWRHVNWAANSIFLADTKNGEPRTNFLHDRTRAELHKLWVGQGSPTQGRVFLNRLGEPYSDSREQKWQGGNPLAKAHATACRRAGVEDFRIHDWRHHWASWCVMSGVDLETIRQEGGWKSLRMVEKYAAVSAEHRRQALAKRR